MPQVPVNRLLRYLNLLIGAVLVLAVCAVYWVAIRVLPQRSGQVDAPLSGPATITRDENGVPHIRAASVEDAIFLQGFVHAQDRLWQMDALRRLAAGELSEVIGKAALDVDRESRRLRVRRLAEMHQKALPPADRAFMAAYARGVNHFLETHRNALPLEFTILRYEPRVWTIVDTILAGLHMHRDLTSTWKDDLLKRSFLNAPGADKALVEQLFPKRGSGEFQPGSNAWVVSGKLTASGKPLLANDPHLEFTIPSTWYLIHLEAPGLNVSGATLAGMPGVIVGHNERIAWGVTNLHYDVQDLYIERMDIRNGQYSVNGKPEQAQPERELIPVKNEKPVEFTNWLTRHGPILTSESGYAIALRWIAANRATFEFPFLQVNMARNWEEFRAALQRFQGPAQNFVYADIDGNIGYQAAGALPIRKTYDGDIPVSGESGEFEWDGYIPFEQLPSAYNPPSGYIVTANQDPFPKDYPYRVNGNFAPEYRARQIRSLLTAKAGWKAEDMLVVQKDVYSPFSHFLAQQVVAAYDKRGTRNTAIADAVEELRRWNGQMEKGMAAPFIATLLYQEARKKLGERAAPGKGAAYEFNMAGPVLERLLRERPKHWFDDYDMLLIESLVDALEQGKRTQGGNVKKWDYGVYIELNVRQPVGGRIPVIGPYFNIGPLPMSGSSSTIKQTSRRIGPSMRFVADLGDWERSLQNITIGQSGQFLSWHYRDQWDEYYRGAGLPMHFKKVEGKVLRVNPKN